MQTRQSLLPEEINDLCFVDVKHNKDVFESLKSNVKVSFDGQRFAYKVFTQPDLHWAFSKVLRKKPLDHLYFQRFYFVKLVLVKESN